MQNSFYEKFGGAWYQNISNFWFPRRHRKLIDFIKAKPNMAVLDISCGTGSMLALIGQKFSDATLYGMDFSESMIRFANRRYPNYFFEIGNAERLPYLNNKFDIVTNSFAFHHYADPEQAIEEVYRVLKPDGNFLLMDVSPNSTRKRQIFDFIAKYIIRDNHVGFKTPEEIRLMLKRANFKSIFQRKIGFPEIVITSAFK